MPSKDSRQPGYLKIGGVGTGRIFQHAHLPAYPPFLSQARLVGFCDLSPERAEAARSKYETLLRERAEKHPEAAEAIRDNIRELAVYADLEAMLEQVDAVDVATHARSRMAVAAAAFERGVHAMVEKPMARTWSEAGRAAGILEKHPGVLCQLNDDNIFDPKYRLIHGLLLRGEIGAVQLLSVIRGCPLESDSLLPQEITALENGGGALMAYGSHGLAGAFSLFRPGGRPVKVEALDISLRHPVRTVKGKPFRMEVDDNAQLKVLMENDETGDWATVFMEATICGGHIGLGREKSGGQSSGYLEIVGDRGMIETLDESRFRLKYWNGGEEIIPVLQFPAETISFQTEMKSFFDACRAGAEPGFGLAFGADVIAACGAAYLSAIRGAAVTLEELKDYSRGFVADRGDGAEADDAIILDLLRPYREAGALSRRRTARSPRPTPPARRSSGAPGIRTS